MANKRMIIFVPDIKQLHISKHEYFDKSTCTTIFKEEIIDENSEISLTKKKENRDSYILSRLNDFDKTFEAGPREIRKENCQNKAHHIDEENIIEIVPNKQFKVIMESSDEKLCDEHVELKSTFSGTLIMVLNHNIIDLIEKRIEEDPNLFAYLNKNSDGYTIVNFDRKRDNTGDIGRISINKTSSGSRLLKINKKFVKNLKNTIDSVSKYECVSGSLHAFEDLSQKKTSISTSKYMIDKSVKAADCSLKINEHDDNTNIATELMKLYKSHANDNALVTLTVQDQNESQLIKAVLTQTLSGQLILNMKDVLPYFIKYKDQEVLLKNSPTGSLTLILENSVRTNAHLKCTRSGTVLVLLKHIKSFNELATSAKFVRIRINSKANTVIEPPVLLKPTASRNYVLVVDKEYEELFMKNIFHQISPNSKINVSFTKTPSETYLINFNDKDADECEDTKAFLVKTASENIKIVLRGAMYDKLEQEKCHEISSLRLASKDFSDLITGFPESSSQLQKENLKYSVVTVIKSSSDSKVYNKMKYELQEPKICDPYAKLQRTDSGKYAVILSKNSKNALFNNLKNYLSNYQDIVPEKINKSEEIIISMNEDREKKGQGSLKNTPSGNICVTVDEISIRDMKADSSNMSPLDKKTNHTNDVVRHHANKIVATSCNGIPDDSFCDSSKCVCKELIESHCRLINSSENSCNCEINDNKNNNDFFKSKGREKKEGIVTKGPHIVPKTCDSQPTLKQKQKYMDQYYYDIESECSYHKNRYQDVSNKLLENSGYKAQKEIQKDILENDNEAWDSLNYLPPQLPPFLKEFCYR